MVKSSRIRSSSLRCNLPYSSKYQYNLLNVFNIPFKSSLFHILVFLVLFSRLIYPSKSFSLPSPTEPEIQTTATLQLLRNFTSAFPHGDNNDTSPSQNQNQTRKHQHQNDAIPSPDMFTDFNWTQISNQNYQSKIENIPGNHKVGMNESTVNELLALKTAKILGLRVEEVSKGVTYEHKGVSLILSEKVATIRLFGDRFTNYTIIRFVTEIGERGTDCDDVSSTKSFHVHTSEISDHSVLSKIELPPLTTGEHVYYLCARENNTDMPWVHQGIEQWLQIKSYETVLPLWVIILFIVVLLLLSGLFSGLNLGLMSLDRTEMKIVANTGTPKERKYARVIQPLRNKGNYLLCSLLLGNVMVNSTLTILLDEVSSGLIAIIVSTLSIVVLGEIIPQAICSRHGLAVGAKTVYLTKFFMLLTFPISYPISVLLDKALGEEIGNVYNRDRLKELIKVTHGYNDLEKDEMNIISGALDLKKKTVKDIMTKLDTVFMLPVDTILDFDTVSEIMAQGYSRIPVFEGFRGKVVAQLFLRDLALYDPADKMPLRRFCQFYNNKIMFVFETTTLDVLFKDFKQGDQGHMAFVQVVTTLNQDSDPYYEVNGVVTLEDVIEELIQAEINDEADVYSYKNERNRPRAAAQHRYPWNDSNEKVEVSPQLCLAAYQYLSTAVEEFDVTRISKNILQRLLNQNFFFQIKIKRENDTHDESNSIIYQRGKPCDYFVLILEGRVQSEMGKENLVFESGPFTFFGVQALYQNTEAPSPTLSRKDPEIGGNISIPDSSPGYSMFFPDYTVRAVTDVTFLRISHSIYMAAIQATMLERTYLNDVSAQKEVVVNFEEQIDKMRNSTHNFSNYVSMSSSDTESGINETDDAYDYNRSNNPSPCIRGSNSLQHLNGTPMERRRRRKGEVLSDIILTPSSFLNAEKTCQDEYAKIAGSSNSDIYNNNITSNNNLQSGGVLPNESIRNKKNSKSHGKRNSQDADDESSTKKSLESIINTKSSGNDRNSSDDYEHCKL